MRLATANIFDTSIATLQLRQNRMQDAQERLTSGKKVEQASDDPTGAARAERAMAAIGRVDANQRALEASRNSMTLTEGALGDATELMQQIRETLVAAGNASYTDSERSSLSTKIAGLRSQLLAIANRPDGGAGYLFSGQGAGVPPFLDTAGGVRYSGTSGQIQTGNGDNFPLTVDGRLAWEQAATGNGNFVTAPLPNSLTGQPPKSWIDPGRVTNPALLTGADYQINISGTDPNASYTVVNQASGATVQSGAFKTGKSIEFDGMAVNLAGAGVDGDAFSVKPHTNDLKVFDVLDQAVAALQTPNRSTAQIVQANILAIRDVDAAMTNLQSVRSAVGETLNNLDGSESRMAALKQYNQAERSAAEDLDMTAAISDFQNQQSGYDAALRTYAMVQRMSLFQYLSN